MTRLVTGDCCCAWRPLCGWTSTSVTFASLLAAEDTLVTADRLRARHSGQVSHGASQQWQPAASSSSQRSSRAAVSGAAVTLGEAGRPAVLPPDR